MDRMGNEIENEKKTNQSNDIYYILDQKYLSICSYKCSSNKCSANDQR